MSSTGRLRDVLGLCFSVLVHHLGVHQVEEVLLTRAWFSVVLQVSRGWRWLCGPRPFGRRLTENRGSVGLVAGEEPVPVANTEGAIEESVDDDFLPRAIRYLTALTDNRPLYLATSGQYGAQGVEG